ncbi:hypothetical protein EYB53_019755 [Candidatus Chloroploca sp. M-50]|uniref:Uncharacterized protein n=1 Tax=Candidatus Chloroploca mongolica TaxID=2528176 RepID=A0ABS4DES5_9CHLR|nr:hypothetical protein [Candidatus Chloroploca mongolica]MBP1467962.1 hypothetical protein [Candidatus Chloroploca mongolica]
MPTQTGIQRIVLPVRDDAVPIRLANATLYGLMANIWMRNCTRGWATERS